MASQHQIRPAVPDLSFHTSPRKRLEDKSSRSSAAVPSQRHPSHMNSLSQSRTTTSVTETQDPITANRNIEMPQGPSSFIPMPGISGPRQNMGSAIGGFEGSKSPPNSKNTSHVPCKFFRLGQCTAGRACPFAHTLDTLSDEICKYFQKGNCKFGQKCALAHVLPNGRRVNRPNSQQMPHSAKGVSGIDFANRADGRQHRQDESGYGMPPQPIQQGAFARQIPMYSDEGRQYARQGPGHDARPDENEFGQSHHGSPPSAASFRPFSPLDRRTVMDAALPASFDSQGISYIARHGPMAASVPSKFGVEFASPTPSMTPAPFGAPVISSTYQDSLNMQRNRLKFTELGSSPMNLGDDSLNPRTMYSQRLAKPTLLSASLPRPSQQQDDWEDDLDFSEGEETDYIPTSLHDQLLTPQEKMRRMSRNDSDYRPSISRNGLTIPSDPSASISASPGASTGSPSRYGAFFAANAARLQDPSASTNNGFGPIGSPLRKLHPDAVPNGDGNTHGSLSNSYFPPFASPPRQSSMSILSQQFSRSRISGKQPSGVGNDWDPRAAGITSTLHPDSASGVGMVVNGGGRRHSSAPIGQSGSPFGNRSPGVSVQTDRIEEEGVGVFSLEEDEVRQ